MTTLSVSEINDAFDTIKALLPYDEDAYALVDVMERRLILAETALATIRQHMGIPNSASGDGAHPSSDQASPVGPLSKAEAEHHSKHVTLVPDVGGLEIGSGKYEALRLIESGERQ